MKLALGKLLRRRGGEEAGASAVQAEKARRGGQPTVAVELCRAELEKSPDLLSTRVTLGWALLDLGRYDEARVELENVLKRAPDNLAAIRGMAQLHDRAQDVAMHSLEYAGDWPPRQADITHAAERAAEDAEQRRTAGPPADPVAAPPAEPVAAPPAEPVTAAAGGRREQALQALEELRTRALARRRQVATEPAA